MNTLYLKIIETVIIIIAFIAVRYLMKRLVHKHMLEKLIQQSRAQIIFKAINLIIVVIGVFTVSSIWGVNQSDLLLFLGSVLTVIGVALFAQWSLSSNITSGIIIFFSHAVKIGDSIQIMEGKDYEVDGKVLNIGLFFVELRTSEGKEISLPNNIFIQKMIKKEVDN
jgi:small-conductance mechanosensitive channel